MKKRICSLILAALLCFALLPAVCAEADDIAFSSVAENAPGTITESLAAPETKLGNPQGDVPTEISSGTCGPNLTYRLSSDGTLSIQGSGAMFDYGTRPSPWYYDSGSVKKICIGQSVTGLDLAAFDYCSNATSYSVDSGNSKYFSQYGVLFDNKWVLLRVPQKMSGMSGSYSTPSSTTAIESWAFGGCTELTDVTISSRVTSIGNAAFYGCSGLTSVTIPSSVTQIGTGAFNGCSSLESVSIPGSVQILSDSVFANCSSMTQLSLPDSVTKIDKNAFYECSALTSITIPAGVTSIGEKAFYNCGSLSHVLIPVSVTSIGYNAFLGCSALRTAGPLEGDYNIRFGWTGSGWAGSIPDNAFYGCDGLESVTIPEGVHTIGAYTFYNCGNLKSVRISSGVKRINNNAFLKCYSLNAVYISDPVAWCGVDFNDTDANPLSYANSLYLNDALLTSLAIPQGVSVISPYAFYNCQSLTSVTIPSSVTSIGEDAFSGCDNLNAVNISDLAAWCGIDFCGIASNPLLYAHDLYLNNRLVTSLVIPEGVSGINSYAFCSSSLTSVTIPSSVTEIGEKAFWDCSGLNSVQISDIAAWCGICFNGAESNPLQYAHSLCLNGAPVAALVIPEGVSSINSYAFCGNSSLTSVTIPSSVASIGENAFVDCTSLGAVYIGDLAAWCGISFGENANPLLHAGNLYLNGGIISSLVIPEGVSGVGTGAFSGCGSLTSVTIPSSVNSVGELAFSGCSGLSDIVFEGSAPSIGSGSFSEVKATAYYPSADESWTETVRANYGGKLSWAAILSSGSCGDALSWKLCDNKVLTISGTGAMEDYAEGGAPWYPRRSEINTIVMKNGITSLGSYAFYNCGNLTSAAIPESLTSIGDYTFSKCYSLKTATIPYGVVSVGSNAFSYDDNLQNMTIPESVASIGDSAFYYCSRLASIEIPGSVKSLGDSAFAWSGLTTLSIGSGVAGISSYAFYECTKLTTVTIADGMTGIGEYAFYHCSKLTSIAIPDSVTSIGINAFQNSSALRSVSIGSGVSSIGLCAFDCYNLVSISVDEDNACYSSQDDVLFDKAQTELICFPRAKGYNYSVPDGVRRIKSYAFYNCWNLRSITIPSSLTEIGEEAFTGCDALEAVYIDDIASWCGITFFSNPLQKAQNLYLNGEAFSELVIPHGVTSIGRSAFLNCQNLNSVTIPASVTEISDYAFCRCNWLSEVIFKGSAPTIGESCFYGVPATVYYPANDASWTEEVRQNCYSGLTWAEEAKLAITSQPKNQAVDLDKSYTFAVKASGDGLSYTWYYKFPGESGFTKSSCTTASYTNVGKINGSGMQMYCVVTDVYGNSVTTNTATLFVYGAPCQIVEQPKNQAVNLNATYTFTCGVAGEGLSYAWYYKFPGESGFTKSSCTTASYSNVGKINGSGMQMYCVVTDKHGNTATSRVATLFVYGAPCQIVEQPKNQAVNLNATYTFTCGVAGEGLSYAWYYKFPGDAGFTKSSCTTASYSNVGKINGSGMQMYCVVRDKYGNTKTSRTATLFVYGAPCQIVSQPQNQAVNLNSTYTFTCGVAGEGLSYTWYYKFPGDSGFTKSSCTTASYSNVGKINGSGMQMYCVVRDKYGNTATSRTATLFVYGAPCQITEQPTSKTVHVGDSYSFTCGVAGEGLSYAWYYKFPGDSGFTKSSATGATYSNTARAGSNGLQMYCVVTDKYGNTRTSNTATLTVK